MLAMLVTSVEPVHRDVNFGIQQCKKVAHCNVIRLTSEHVREFPVNLAAAVQRRLMVLKYKVI